MTSTWPDYDFSKARRNPYARRLKKQVTLRVDESTLAYFKKIAGEIAIPYQTLINMYLRNCAARNKRLRLEWESAAVDPGRVAPASDGGVARGVGKMPRLSLSEVKQ